MGQKHVGAVVVICGLRRVWEKVLEREGLSKKVKILGGGRIADGFVVTAAIKSALVSRLQHTYQMYIWAFEDSPLDLEMLYVANQAIVVTGEEQTRSKTMNLDLFNLIYDGSLRAELQVLYATGSSAAKLLMTPMRDARNTGRILREAHRRVGWYLATELLAKVVGVEEYPISHVQGHQTSGFRLFAEQETTIVALMRGGEAMAFGVNDALPLAMFVHTRYPDDIKLHHLQKQCTVLLVDSMVNSGKTVVKFVQHIKSLHATIRIVVIAGVVQAQSVSKGILAELALHVGFSIVALRLSDNKFTGTGTTNTSNRLFNTTHLL